MATQKESNLQRNIKQALIHEFGGLLFKMHGGPYMPAGLPDLIGCIAGFYVAVEVKTSTGVVSEIQKETMRDIREAGGIAFVARNKEQAIRQMRRALNGKFSNQRIKRIWKHMQERCYYLKTHNYHNYGGRGIKVCDRWRSSVIFFWEDMGHPPDTEDTLYQIDRIDVDGDYSPENCRWVTPTQNANNKRNTKRYTYKGETHTLPEWAALLSIKPSTLRFHKRK